MTAPAVEPVSVGPFPSDDPAATRILLSCVPVKNGGGRTVAWVTARTIVRSPHLQDRITVVARRSFVDKLDGHTGASIIPVSNHRLVAELQLWRLARRSSVDWVVSIFGPPPLLTAGKRSSTVCAYSALFHPQVDHKRHPGRLRRFGLRAVDRARRSSLGRSDIVFFETEVMRRRATDQLRRPAESLRVLRPAREPELERELDDTPRRPDDGLFRVLLFSADRPNKGWSILPAVARELDRRQLPVELLLTVDDANDLDAETGTASSRIRSIGPVPAAARGELLASTDAMLLVSELESYSNNCHEAWSAGIPLIVSDKDWSRAAAGDAAIFVNPHSATSIADGIEAAMGAETRAQLRTLGHGRLSRMPTPAERMEHLCDVLGGVPE